MRDLRIPILNSPTTNFHLDLTEHIFCAKLDTKAKIQY